MVINSTVDNIVFTNTEDYLTNNRAYLMLPSLTVKESEGINLRDVRNVNPDFINSLKIVINKLEEDKKDWVYGLYFYFDASNTRRPGGAWVVDIFNQNILNLINGNFGYIGCALYFLFDSINRYGDINSSVDIKDILQTITRNLANEDESQFITTNKTFLEIAKQHRIPYGYEADEPEDSN